MNLVVMLCNNGFCMTHAEARRFIFQGMVFINGQRVILEEQDPIPTVKVTDKVEVRKKK